MGRVSGRPACVSGPAWGQEAQFPRVKVMAMERGKALLARAKARGSYRLVLVSASVLVLATDSARKSAMATGLV